ncbi:hemolysin-III channel protein-like protein Izh2, partial [Glonium stellatum]
HYIETGYRRTSGSIRKCIHSWTYLHNESVNIHSHLFGSILFLTIPIYVFRTQISPRFAVATAADIKVCSIYFLGVSICFLFSAVYHTITNHSHEYSRLGLELDYQGIILLMWGATVPLIYYGFKCDPLHQKLYWFLLSAFAMACSVMTFQPRFRDAHLQRAIVFGCLALSTALPVLHSIMKYGVKIQFKRMGLVWVIVTLALNALGAGAYAIHYPEKWFPRRFDIFGASHQILHIMVVLAGLAHTIAILQAFDFLHNHRDTCML